MGTGVPRIRFALVPLLLLALNLLGGNLGPLSPTTCRGAAFVLIVIACLACAAVAARSSRRALHDRAALLSISISLIMLWAGDARAIGIGGLALACFGLSRFLRDVDPEGARSMRALFQSSCLYLVVLIIIEHVPLAWNSVHALSMTVSATVGHLVHTEVVQGPSTGGVYVFVSLLGYLVARASVSSVRQWVVFDVGAVLLIALFLAQLGTGPWIAVQLARVGLPALAARPQVGAVAGIEDSLAAMYSPLLLMSAGLLLVLLLEPMWIGAEIPSPAATGTRSGRSGFRRGWIHVGAGAACCLAVAALLWGQYPGEHPANTSSRILFYRDGKDTLRKFDVPDFQHLGTANAGMFGLLPAYLKACGYDPKLMEATNDGVTEQMLQGCGTLVIINPDRPFPKTELETIWKFVGNGGALLVLGDHTDIAGTMSQLNALLAPVDIRFNFDSAFTATHWLNVPDPLPHPMTAGLDSANHRLQHSTGASLTIGGRVRPVVSARWAFSDVGNHDNKENAFLGDYAYQLNEPLSDMVIIAESGYGAGKVLVFGDTSAFQNIALPHSFSFIERVFRHLSRGRTPQSWPGVVGACVLAGVWLLGSRVGMRMLSQPIPVIAVFPSLVLIWAWPHVGAAGLETPQMNGPVACIDAAHVNRFSLGFWKDDSVNGLSLNLARNGYLPLLMNASDQGHAYDGAKLLAVIAPAEAYSDEELHAVRQFVEAGGLLILSVGYEEKAGSEGLLRLTGFDIREEALGPVPIEPPQRTTEALAEIMRVPHFRKAWPLISTDPSPVEVFYRQGMYDIMAFRRIGKGGALVIADPCFLYDQTLEAEKAWWPGNIELIRSVLTTLRSRGVGT